jgi:hypothetical protein
MNDANENKTPAPSKVILAVKLIVACTICLGVGVGVIAVFQ